MNLAEKLRVENLAKLAADHLAEKQAAERKQADAEFSLAEFRKELLSLPAKLEAEAKKGATKYSITKSEMKEQYYKILQEFASTNGLRVIVDDVYCPEERPDKDSGEGGNPAGFVYVFTLTWGTCVTS